MVLFYLLKILGFTLSCLIPHTHAFGFHCPKLYFTVLFSLSLLTSFQKSFYCSFKEKVKLEVCSVCHLNPKSLFIGFFN